jgi:hypothetical protein
LIILAKGKIQLSVIHEGLQRIIGHVLLRCEETVGYSMINYFNVEKLGIYCHIDLNVICPGGLVVTCSAFTGSKLTEVDGFLSTIVQSTAAFRREVNLGYHVVHLQHVKDLFTRVKR